MQHQQHPAQMAASVGQFQPGSAMVYMTTPRTYDRYKHRQSIGLGLTQIIIGILCVVFNSVCIGASYNPGNALGAVGHGYWCGIMFTITGIFGVIAGRKKTRCQIVTFMVLCIISASLTVALLVVGIIGALSARNYDCPSYGYYYDYPYYRSPCSNMERYETLVAMESLLAICGLVEAIVAIWGSALCCGSGVCCCSNPMMVLSSNDYFPPTGQVIYMSQTHGGPYVYAQQPTFSFDQGTTQPPSYVQSSCAMPATNIGPALGQTPPAYNMANQAQPLWMNPPSMTNQGLMAAAAQAPSTFPGENEKKASAA